MLLAVSQRSDPVEDSSPEINPSDEFKILEAILPALENLVNDLVEHGNWAWRKISAGPRSR